MDDRFDPSAALIGQIYDASFDSALWRNAVDAFRIELDGALSALFFRDQALSGTDVGVLGTSGYSDSSLVAYSDYYATRDVRSPVIGRLPLHEIYVDD